MLFIMDMSNWVCLVVWQIIIVCLSLLCDSLWKLINYTLTIYQIEFKF